MKLNAYQVHQTWLKGWKQASEGPPASLLDQPVSLINGAMRRKRKAAAARKKLEPLQNYGYFMRHFTRAEITPSNATQSNGKG
jgi:hypothetical protein